MSETRRLYGAVVVQCLKDTVRDAIWGRQDAVTELEAWLRSDDGREVAGYAGIELREAAIQAVMHAVGQAVQDRNPYRFARGWEGRP